MNKKIVIILSVVVSVVAVAAAILLVFNRGAQSGQSAVLSAKEGEVFVMKAGADNWVEAQVGLSLEQGDAIKTAVDSRAEITFFEGSTIELESDTVLNLSELDMAEDTGSTTIMLEQEVGKSISRITKLTDTASRYDVETPAGVAAVRGSIMEVEVEQQGITRVFNQEGLIVAIAQGVEVQIPEGMYSIIIPGQPPSLPTTPGGEGAGSIRITKSIMSVENNVTTYIYEVTNIGDTPQSNVYVTDPTVNVITYVSGDTNNNNILDPGETWIFTGT